MKTRPCEICKELIDPERIEAVPATRLCGTHAREIARFGGEFTLSSTTESLNKTGSLKKNYGGIDLDKKRNTLGLAKLREEYERTRDS